MCAALGVGERQGYAYVKRKMPQNGDGSFDIQACLEWQAENVREAGGNHKKRQPIDPASEEAMLDPSLTGSSPALERFRHARAGLAELELETRQGQFLSRDKVHECFGKVANLLRSAGEMLQRQFGADALGILNEALNEGCRAVADLCQREIDTGNAGGIRLDAAGGNGPAATNAD